MALPPGVGGRGHLLCCPIVTLGALVLSPSARTLQRLPEPGPAQRAGSHSE